MSPWLDLNQLLRWESSTVEWKKVGDPLEIVRKLTAFANGEIAGIVVCGIEEARDEHGFVRPLKTGLTAGELSR
ncbi:MAG: hypothetical protein HC897_20455 [Thermoanaerobaculia bacterium]|nr:hypothetical protein [Thermoanaerobaculia bacterium]